MGRSSGRLNDSLSGIVIDYRNCIGNRVPTHPQRGKDQPKTRSFAKLAVNFELTSVPLNHMLDDGQPQARSTSIPRSASVDTVEALAEPREMLF